MLSKIYTYRQGLRVLGFLKDVYIEFQGTYGFLKEVYTFISINLHISEMFQGAERIGFEFTELHRSLRKSRNCYSDLGFKRWGEGWAIVGALSVGGDSVHPPDRNGRGGSIRKLKYIGILCIKP